MNQIAFLYIYMSLASRKTAVLDNCEQEPSTLISQTIKERNDTNCSCQNYITYIYLPNYINNKL